MVCISENNTRRLKDRNANFGKNQKSQKKLEEILEKNKNNKSR